MSEYQKVCLGELITHQKGFAFKSKDYVDSGVPVVRVSNFTADAIDTNDLKFVNSEIAEQNHKVSLKTDDVIISTVGSWPNNPASIVGKTVRVLPEMDGALMNQNSVVLRVNSGDFIDQKYLFIALKNKPFTNHLIATAQGSANQASITLSDIFSYEIEWPSFEKRESIVSAIDSLNQKILLNRQTNQTLEQIAQAFFKSWFVDFEPTRAKIAAKQAGQDPEHAAMAAISGKAVAELEQLGAEQLAQLKTTAALFPDELVESELGEVPEGWEVSTLADLCQLNGTSWTKKNQPEEVWYIDLANTKHGVVEEVHHYFWDDAPSRAKRILQQGDTIVGTVRPGNRSFSFIGHTDKVLTASTGFAVLTPLRESLSEFVYLAATGDENIDRLAHLADGGAYPAVKPDVVISLGMPIPTDELINNFSSYVKSLFEARSQNLASEANLKELRDTLLPKLLSGELSPTKTETV